MSISGGAAHTVFLDPSGAVCAVGFNHYGQQGQGDTSSALGARIIPQLPPIAKVATGDSHTACVTHEGALYCFGNGFDGQLGLGDTNHRFRPTLVPDLPPIRQVACGEGHTICIGDDQRVWVFGYNEKGQLGLGDTQPRNIPTLLPLCASDVACGSRHSLILTTEGALYAMGENEQGQLGLGHQQNQCTPQRVHFDPPLVDAICQLQAGEGFSLIMTNLGIVYATGDNRMGQLALGDVERRVHFSPLPNLTALRIGCGRTFAMALSTDHLLYTWGSDDYGAHGMRRQLHNTPVPLELPAPVKAFFNGLRMSFILCEDNAVFVCGKNNYGQLWADNLVCDIGLTRNDNIHVEMFSHCDVLRPRKKSARTDAQYK